MQSICSPLQPTISPSFFFQMGKDSFFMLSVEALRLKLTTTNNYEDLELRFSSGREIIRECAKDLGIIEERVEWYKVCSNWHEIKLGGDLTKTKANQLRRDKHVEFEKNKTISIIKTENRGKCTRKKYDPFILFRHVENCPECTSKPVQIFKKKRTSVLLVLDIVEKIIEYSGGGSEELYEKIFRYIFH